MALNYVTLTLDLADGSGNLPGRGCAAAFAPSAVLTDSGVTVIDQAPVTAVFTGIAQPAVTLLATDSAGPQPAGWTWGVTFTGPGMPAPFSFFLPFAGGANQVLSALIPVQSGASFQAVMPLPSGTPSAGEVPVATGTGEQSAWQQPAVASVFGRTGAVTAQPGDYTAAQVGALPASDDLSAIAAANPAAANVPMNNRKITGLGSGSAPADAAAYGQVPAGGATVTIGQGGTGQATQQAAIDALTGPQSAGKVLRSDGAHATLAAIQAGDVPDLAYVDSVTAADSSVVVGGTPDSPTVRTGTLDVIASQHPPAAAVGMNGQKITSLASGTASSDAAAFGQLPSASSPLAIASGGTGQTSAAAALSALGGAADGAVVHLAGAETITGAKTFSVPPSLAAQSVSGTATLAAASAPVVLTDTTAGAFTLTLPASPVTGEFFIVVDSAGKWDSSPLVIARNGKSIDGAASDLTLATQWGKLWLYYDGTAWWSLAAGAWTGTGTATYTLSVDRTGAFPAYTAKNAAGQVVISAADTAATSGLKAVLTAIAPNNTDDFSIHLTAGRFHFLDAPLGTESWAGVEDHYQFTGNNNVTLEGEGPQSIISNYTNLVAASPDPQPLMLFGCSRWRIRNLAVEGCGKTRAPSNTINGDGVTNSVIEQVRVTAAIGHAIAIDGGYNGQWGGNTVIRDCLIQGRPAAPVLAVGSGGSLAVQAFQYATAWRCNGLGVFSCTGTSSGTTATITTGSAHTYQSGDSVSISGMSVAGYNGTFIVTVTGSTTFTYATSGSGIGAGTGGTAIGADVTKPGDPTTAVTSPGSQKVVVTLQRGPYSCVGRVVYRWDGSNWLQVGTVSDNTTATFTDNGITGSAVTFAHKSTIQGAGIEIMAANGCVVDGNVIDGTGDMVNGASSSQNGIHIVQKAVGALNVPADHNVFADNVVRQTGSHGIRVVGGSNNVIAGNQVSNPGTPSVKAQAIRLEGIASVNTNANLVTGNNTYDDQTASSWSGGASTSSSVSITATNSPAGNVLGPNVMTGYTSSSPVSDSGTASQLEAAEKTIVLMAQGTLAVTTKVSNFQFAAPWPGIIKRARLIANTGPAGAAVICDFLLNGTTIWSTQGNRVQIAAGATSGTQASFNTTSFAAGDVFTFNVAQVGSSTPGADLVMELTVLASRVYP